MDLSPHDESAVQRCIAVLAERGDLAGALRCFEEFDTRLRRDLELAIDMPAGYSSLGGQVKNPYAPDLDDKGVPIVMPVATEIASADRRLNTSPSAVTCAATQPR
mgnify:CR=1 FL=1